MNIDLRRSLLIGLMLWGTFSSISLAQAPDNEPPGFHGTLGLGVGELQKTSLSQFRIFSFEDDPETVRQIVPLPSLDFRYVDASGHWGFGLPEGKLGISREQNTDFGTIRFGMGFSIFNDSLDEFKNPYQLGVHRDRTSTTERNQELSYEVGEGVGLELGLEREEKVIRNDNTPSVHPDLGRNAVTEKWNVGLRLFFVSLQVGQILTNAKGDAESSLGTEAGFFVFVPLKKNFNVIASFSETQTVFNTTHPVFDRKRKDYTQNNFVRMQFSDKPYNYYVMGFGTIQKSNIEFFDSSRQLIGLGFDYNF